MAPFGITVTAVEPRFFRTDLLDARNARYASSTIADYAADGSAEAMWSGYDGQQQGDPARLSQALVAIAGMEAPPAQFLADSDAVAGARPALEARRAEIAANEALSRSTDGAF